MNPKYFQNAENNLTICSPCQIKSSLSLKWINLEKKKKKNLVSWNVSLFPVVHAHLDYGPCVFHSFKNPIQHSPCRSQIMKCVIMELICLIVFNCWIYHIAFLSSCKNCKYPIGCILREVALKIPNYGKFVCFSGALFI